MRSPRLILIAGIVVWLIAVFPTQTAGACTTPYQPVSLHTDIEEADYIVKATVIQVDDASQNAILRAETYLTGGRGPGYLLFYRADPALSAVFYGHHYDTGCTYGGANPIELHSSGYFALRRLPNGAYTYIHDMHSFESRIFTPPSGTVELRVDPAGDDSFENIAEVEISSEQEFVDLVAELSGESPAWPRYTPLPRLTPLRITTDSGAQYVLPVDGGALVEQEPGAWQPEWSPGVYPDLFGLPPFCNAVGCELSAPDFSLFAVQADENTLHADYPYRPPGEGPLITLAGQAFAFSPTGESLLVWNEDTLVVYLISNAYCACSYGEFIPYLYALIEIPLAVTSQVNAESLRGQAVWSADGTTFAYADAEGVGLLDIFRQGAPERVAGVENGLRPSPLYLSTTGRYVAYTYTRADRNWIAVDRVTRQQHENAIVSPNERYIAYIDPPSVEPAPDETDCHLPVMEDCRLVLERPRYFEWFDEEAFFQVTCATEARDDCTITGWPVGYRQFTSLDDELRVSGYRIYFGDVAYEPEQDLFAYVDGPQTLRIEDVYGEIRLSGQIDGEIIAIEWLPSLFYRH